MEDKKIIEERVSQFLNFLVEEGVVEESLKVTFENTKPTHFMSTIPLININMQEIQDMENANIGDKEVTCGNNEILLKNFTHLEIAFFHELGHYCDLYYRFNNNKTNMAQQVVDSRNIMALAHELPPEYYKDEHMRKFIRKERFKVYRMIPSEVYADRNARLLMLFCLESL